MGLSSDSLISFLWIPCEQLSDYSLSISRKLFSNLSKTTYQFPENYLANYGLLLSDFSLLA